MRKKTIWATGVLLALAAGTAAAHVPYLETTDLTFEAPFRPWSAAQSIAVYGWLGSGEDVDWYSFTVTEEMKAAGTPVFVEVLVPAFEPYRDFRPSFALVGPGLPAPTETLPVTPAPGCGALVFHDPGATPRETFSEPFGGKTYYRGPKFEQCVPPGTYTVVVFDRGGKTGDYVAAIGKKEIWRPKDIWRAIRVTPVIRRGGELHLPR